MTYDWDSLISEKNAIPDERWLIHPFSARRRKHRENRGISGCIYYFADPCVAGSEDETPPRCCFGSEEFPLGRGRKGSAWPLDGTFAETCFEQFVGEWSAKTRKQAGFSLVFFAFSHLDLCAHNPEVVGSSPASATKEVLRLKNLRTFSFLSGQKVGSF